MRVHDFIPTRSTRKSGIELILLRFSAFLSDAPAEHAEQVPLDGLFEPPDVQFSMRIPLGVEFETIGNSAVGYAHPVAENVSVHRAARIAECLHGDLEIRPRQGYLDKFRGGFLCAERLRPHRAEEIAKIYEAIIGLADFFHALQRVSSFEPDKRRSYQV